MVLVFGMVVVGCNSNNIAGTWINSEDAFRRIIFDNNGRLQSSGFSLDSAALLGHLSSSMRTTDAQREAYGKTPADTMADMLAGIYSSYSYVTSESKLEIQAEFRIGEAILTTQRVTYTFKISGRTLTISGKGPLAGTWTRS